MTDEPTTPKHVIIRGTHETLSFEGAERFELPEPMVIELPAETIKQIMRCVAYGVSVEFKALEVNE